jgi:DNA-binding response OmpR family regulator
LKRILVVESTRPVDGLSGSLFRRRECTLLVASSGAEALALAEKEMPELIIYDDNVGDFTSEDFVQALHSREGSDEVPVMVILDQGDEAREGPILRAGASAVVFHPPDEIEMNAKVCELLGISLRRHVRTFVKMKVDATLGASTHFATIGNISLGGVLIETEQRVRAGDIIKLSFFLPGDDEAITVISKVVREVPAAGEGRAYGCQFLDLSDVARTRIHEFVSAAEDDE